MAHFKSLLILTTIFALVHGFVVQENKENSANSIVETILNDKFAFLENKLKQFNVDIEAIKERIKAGKDRQHGVQKREIDDIDTILSNKFAFLENKLKQYNIDFEVIKEKIKAGKDRQHGIQKREVGDIDTILNNKFAFLENKLKQYNVDVEAIKEKIKAGKSRQHGIEKREIGDIDAILTNKFAFLEDKLKQYNIDVEAIKEKIKAGKQWQHGIRKREISDAETGIDSRTDLSNGLSGLLDGIFGAVSTALKSMTDALLATLNKLTNGVFGELLINIQAFIYGIIDKIFPATSTTYTSSLYYFIEN